MCTLKELQNGTYSLYDLELMHQIIELRSHVMSSAIQAQDTNPITPFAPPM